jgi:glycine oxidase
MNKQYEVGIIGGGIIGQSIAYHLAKEGVSVLVLESHKIGTGATSAAAGMLGANSELEKNDTFYQFAKESQRLYHSLQYELSERSQINIGLIDKGMYKIAMNDDEADSLKEAASYYESVEWHEKEMVLEHEPTLSTSIKGALYIKEDGHVSPLHVCAAFSKSASLLGATILENSPVHAIKKTSKNGFTLSTPRADFSVNKVVIANGVWSEHFFKQLGVNAGMKPVKGECLSVKSSEISLEKTIFYDHCYIVPKGDGRIVIGATMVEDDWSTAPTIGGIQSLIEKITPIMPSIASSQLYETWSGLRPQSHDGKPYIGQHPDGEHIYFATGHYRNGILLAPKTGEMVRDLILGRQQNEDYINTFSIVRPQLQAMR